jgi:Fe-S cluster assembly scaffold protein SufB
MIPSDEIRIWSKSRNEPEWLLELRLKNFELFNHFRSNRIADSPVEEMYFNKNKYLQNMLDNISKNQKIEGLFEYKNNRVCFDLSQNNDIDVHLTLDGAEIIDINNAIYKYPDAVKESMNYATDEYMALRNALWNIGLFVYIPKNKVIKKKINLNTIFGENAIIKNDLFFIGENSEVEFVNYTNIKEPSYSLDGATYILNNSSKLKSIYLGDGSSNSLITVKNSILKEKSKEEWYFALKSFDYHLMDSKSVYKGELSNSKILGAGIGKNKEVYESITDSLHLAQETSSFSNIKVALTDYSRAIMRGNIKIEKTAAKSNAFYAGNALLLNRGANSITLPFLEIFGSGSVARHAATSTNVDPDHIFYLLTRGLDEVTAKKILIDGFLDDVVREILITENTRFLKFGE